VGWGRTGVGSSRATARAGQGREDVRRRRGARAARENLGPRGQLSDEGLEEFPLPFEGPFARGQKAGGERFELLRGVALDVLEGLAADVVFGDGRRERARDLEAVAEETLVANAQRRDPGPLPFAGLEREERPAAVAVEFPQFVEFRIVAGGEEPSVLEGHGDLGCERAREPLAHLREGIEIGAKPGEERNVREGGEGVGERDHGAQA
jgi:hypothetical protein